MSKESNKETIQHFVGIFEHDLNPLVSIEQTRGEQKNYLEEAIEIIELNECKTLKQRNVIIHQLSDDHLLITLQTDINYYPDIVYPLLYKIQSHFYAFDTHLDPIDSNPAKQHPFKSTIADLVADAKKQCKDKIEVISENVDFLKEEMKNYINMALLENDNLANSVKKVEVMKIQNKKIQKDVKVLRTVSYLRQYWMLILGIFGVLIVIAIAVMYFFQIH